MKKLLPLGIALGALALGTSAVLAASSPIADQAGIVIETIAGATDLNEVGTADQSGDQGQKGELDQAGQSGDQGQKGEVDQAGQTGDQGQHGDADTPAAPK